MTAPAPVATVPDPFRMLISYHYFKTADLDAMFAEQFPTDPPPEVFADSGAFSAVTQGAPIDVHDFARWATKYRRHFRVIANLDVIGDGDESAEGTWRNQRILEDEYGLPVLPVFHAGEPWSVLDRLLEHGYRYIALGGLVGRPVKSIMPWLVSCFRRVHGQAVFHGFGLTSWPPMSELPWYSLDSSSWGAGYRYGFLRMYDPKRKRLRQLSIGRRQTDVYGYAYLIRDLGFDPADLVGEKVDRALLCRLSSVAWRHVETELRNRHGRVEMPGDPDGAHGLRLYLADGSDANLIDGAHGLRLYLADTNAGDLAIAAGHHNDKTGAST